jgi:hypothetical protein
MDEETEIAVLMVQSLFPAMRLTEKMKIRPLNDRLRRVTKKAWCRHWRRVIKYNKIGKMKLYVPDWYLNEQNS